MKEFPNPNGWRNNHKRIVSFEQRLTKDLLPSSDKQTPEAAPSSPTPLVLIVVAQHIITPTNENDVALAQETSRLPLNASNNFPPFSVVILLTNEAI